MLIPAWLLVAMLCCLLPHTTGSNDDTNELLKKIIAKIISGSRHHLEKGGSLNPGSDSDGTFQTHTFPSSFSNADNVVEASEDSASGSYFNREGSQIEDGQEGFPGHGLASSSWSRYSSPRSLSELQGTPRVAWIGGMFSWFLSLIFPSWGQSSTTSSGVKAKSDEKKKQKNKQELQTTTTTDR